MSFASACQSWSLHEEDKVMFSTWGHLYPKLGSKTAGFIEFIIGGFQAVDCQPAHYEFGDLPDSPVLYDDVQDFLIERFTDEEEHAWGKKKYYRAGLYRWEGIYWKRKDQSSAFIKGRIKCIYLFKTKRK